MSDGSDAVAVFGKKKEFQRKGLGKRGLGLLASR